MPIQALGHDGTTLASVSGGSARLWDLVRRSRTDTLALSLDQGVEQLVFSPDGRRLAVTESALGGDRNTVAQIWDTSTAKLQRTVEVKGGTQVAFSPDGNTLATTGGLSRLVNLSTGAAYGPSYAQGQGGLFWPAFSPDGGTLATGASRLSLFDVGAMRQLGDVPLPDVAEGIGMLAFSPDGTILATAGQDAVRLWSVKERRMLGQAFRGHTGSIWRVAFSPDGRRLHSVGVDGTVREQPVDPALVLEAVCARAGRELTEREWAAHIPGMPRRTVCVSP